MAKQSSMIRDLVINVKANDLTKTANESERLVSAMVDAAEGSELLKGELASVSKSLTSIRKQAESTQAVFQNFQLNASFKKSLDSLMHNMAQLRNAAEPLKGITIGINLKVGNLTALQGQIEKSVQGLDISINLKVGNLQATNTKLESVVNSLQDAAVGVELLNTELSNTKSMIAAIAIDADIAATALGKVALSKGLENGLDNVVHVLNNISEEIVQLNLDTQESFGKMDKSVELLDDSLGSVNKTLHQTKFATRDVKKSTDTLSTNIDKIANSNTNMGKKVADSTRGMRNQSRMMGDLAKLAGPIPATFAIISAHIWAISAAFDYLASGDQLNRLENIGTVIGANIGLPVQSLARQMVEVTNGAISYEAALRKAANASGYGFSSDELAKMTEVARRAAVVMGVDMDDALNRIIKGVSKQEIELLDELGITVRLTEAQSAYAKQLGVSADSLTSYQKQQAYLQAVLAQSEKAFGFLSKTDLGATGLERLGAAAASTTSKIAQLMATVANFALGDALKETELDKARNKLEELENTLDSLRMALAKGNLGAGSKLAGGVLNDEDIAATGTEVAKLRAELKAAGLQYDETTNSIVKVTDVTGGWMGINAEATKAAREYNTAMNNNRASVDRLIALSPKYQEMLNKQREIQNELVKQFGYLDSFPGAQSLIASLTEISKNTDALGKTGKEGIGKFRDAIKDTKDPISDYNTSLQDVVKSYEMIDKLKVNFPMIPQAALDKLTSYVDKIREAMGFGSRGAVNDAISRGQAYQNFITNTRDVSGISGAQTNLSGVGGLSGSSDVTNARRELAEYSKELELVKGKMSDSLNGDERLANTAKQHELQQKIYEAELRVIQTNQTLADSKRAILEQDTRRNNLEMQYNQMTAAGASVASLKNELADLQNMASAQERLGIAAEIRYQTQTDILDKQYQINAATVAEEVAAISRKRAIDGVSVAMSEYSDYLSGNVVETAQAVDAEKAWESAVQTRAKYQEAFAAGNAGIKQDTLIAADLEVERARLAALIAREAEVAAISNRDSLNLQIDASKLNLGELSVAKSQADIEQTHLENLESQKASKTAILDQTLKAAEAEAKVNDILASRARGLLAGGIGAIQGENQAQYTSTFGMNAEQAQLAGQSDKLANVANSFDQLASYDQPFANVAANLSQMAIAIQDNAGAMEIASMAGQTITSMYQMNGQAAVDAIDAQIAAEQKRDGKSAESLAKIRALEAKKIETTRKTARQTIIMQTAVGVANALAMGNPFIGIPMAIAVAAMGMQALKAADSSAEASLAGLDSTSSTGSLTLGDRTNKVDTARTANAGELSYIQGSSGIGGIQNFTPRASGGSVSAGHAYIAGEKGPELIVPKTDSVVSDAQTTRSGGSLGGSITLNVNAIDARSFQDLVYANPRIFQDAVEISLNQQGRSLT